MPTARADSLVDEPIAPVVCLSPAKVAILYGALHAVVDLACVISVWRTGASDLISWLTSFWLVLGYDVIAFAAQAPLGALVDRLRCTRAATLAGVALATLALLLTRYSALGTLLAAGLGNALFHLGAGAVVLRRCGPRTAPAGFFVAPGALGLALGTWMGKSGTGPAWPLVALLVLAIPLVDRIDGGAAAPSPEANSSAVGPRQAMGVSRWWLALLLLLASVAIRSFVGYGACAQCSRGVALAVGIALAGFGGKALGGVVADRLGWIAASVGALLLSAPLIAFNGGALGVALTGVLIFQMTMPVTLVAVRALMPSRPATAFGLPCLALIAGALPTFFPAGRAFFVPGLLGALAVASAAAVWGALRAMGLRVGDRGAAAVESRFPDLAVGEGDADAVKHDHTQGGVLQPGPN